MEKLKFLLLAVIICSALVTFVFASENYEHISSWNKLSPNIEFICGENNRDEEVFNNTSIGNADKTYYKIITFRSCRFHEFEKSFFETFKNLHTLNLTGVELEKLDVKAFREAKNLTKLIASNNRLTEISPHLFINAFQIEYLDFANNSIQHIQPTFEGATQLKTLNLSYNRIDELKSNWSHPLSSLSTLDLSHNNLSHLNEHVFDQLINLKHLNLSQNPIGNLKIGTFAHLTQLEVLSLKRTNISSIQLGTFSHQDKLISLDLSENQLKQMDFSLFLPIMNHLQSLDLSKNQLIELNSFRNEIVPQLKFLDLKSNRFNCSYLQRFMTAVKWEKIELPVDPHETITDQEHIRGINCIENKSSHSQSLGNNSNGSGLVSSHDLTLIKISLITLCGCVIIVILLIVFLGRHRLFRCAYRQEDFGQSQSTTTLDNNQNVNFKSEQRLYHTID